MFFCFLDISKDNNFKSDSQYISINRSLEFVEVPHDDILVPCRFHCRLPALLRCALPASGLVRLELDAQGMVTIRRIEQYHVRHSGGDTLGLKARRLALAPRASIWDGEEEWSIPRVLKAEPRKATSLQSTFNVPHSAASLSLQLRNLYSATLAILPFRHFTRFIVVMTGYPFLRRRKIIDDNLPVPICCHACNAVIGSPFSSHSKTNAVHVDCASDTIFSGNSMSIIVVFFVNYNVRI
jgi:hypothetical protein